jgi:hypothetical protein
MDATLKQERLTKHTKDPSATPLDVPKVRSIKYESGRTLDINVADFKGHPLWTILIETARSNPLFVNRAGIAHSQIIPNNPKITPKELAHKLAITVGEALAILEGYEVLE